MKCFLFNEFAYFIVFIFLIYVFKKYLETTHQNLFVSYFFYLAIIQLILSILQLQ